MSTEKRLKKAKKLLKEYGEPVTNAFNYKASLIHFFNYHNTNTPSSELRKWAVDHLKSYGKKIPDLRDIEFLMLGKLVRLRDIEGYMEDAEVEKIEEESMRILSSKVASNEPTIKKDDRSDKIEATLAKKASEFIGEFEGLIDDYTTNDQLPNIGAFVTTFALSNRAIPKVEEWVKKHAEEYRNILNDKEALSYYNLSKPQLKKICGFYETLLEKLSQNKKIREVKPRKVKEKPAALVAKRLKYLISDEALGLKSVPPASIIGASEAYIYRTDRRLIVYLKALDGMTLTVNGTTILNYDESKSFSKTLRKPEETLVGIQTKGKLDTRMYVRGIKSKELGLTGRTNDKTIIINAFK